MNYKPKVSGLVSGFLTEFQELATNTSLQPGKPIFIGDFNFHMDDTENVSVRNFLEILTSMCNCSTRARNVRTSEPSHNKIRNERI